MEHLMELLKSNEKTAEYLMHLMLTGHSESMTANQEIVCTALISDLGRQTPGFSRTSNWNFLTR
jgi:uncharacterized protein YsxB (DUF464 family)